MATGDQDYTGKCHCCCQMPDKGHVARLEAELSRLKALVEDQDRAIKWASERNGKLEEALRRIAVMDQSLTCNERIDIAKAALDGNGEVR